MQSRPHGVRALSSELVADVASIRASRGLVARLRLILLVFAGLLIAHLARGDVLGARFQPLALAIAPYGLTIGGGEASAVAAQRRGAAIQTVVFRARPPGEPADVFIAEAAIAPSGQVAELTGVHNLTQTSSANEQTPVLLDHWALIARRVEGRYAGFDLLDLAGEAPLDRGLVPGLQRGISNLQSTGRFRGVGRRSYALAVPADTLRVRTEGRVYVLEIDGTRAVIDPLEERAVGGAALFDVRTHKPAVAAPLPWLVDTVRALPFVGAERIAWLENRAFAVRDTIKRLYHRVNEVDHAAEAAAELGIEKKALSHVEEKVERLSVPNPESGWPPPSLEPITASDTVLGEGKWRALVDDPHVRTLPSGAPVFYQTFLHTDPERSWARVYLTVWDPRIVQLHIVAGTEEPVSATGETGSGSIPRTADTLTRLVGAFNGGFQAMHGEFGMMAEGRVYLPPKPWAATVAVFDDGRVAMGSWPGPRDRKVGYDEARAVAQIPRDMWAFRQNLTSLVEGDRFNPWGRWWWGAAPQQRSEQTLTQRSALCFTREGFMIYAWGDSASPEALGAALLRARCLRAMHLDMNAGHSGMELYNVLAPSEPRREVAKKEAHRYEGTIAELPGYLLRARKAVTAMGMALPRYVRADPRDFFYLSLKRGIETAARDGTDDGWSSADLPHAGWPPAFARASTAGVRLLRIDPARAQPTTGPAPSDEVVLAELRGTSAGARLEDSTVFAVRAPLGKKYGVGVAPPDAEVLLSGPLLASTPDALAAIGVDRDGLLVYAECAGGADPRADKRTCALASTLAGVGVETAVALPRAARIGLAFREGVLGLDASTRLREPAVALRFVASSRPAVELLFPDNPDNQPMPYGRWASLQDQRVRYFRTTEPTTRAPEARVTNVR